MSVPRTGAPSEAPAGRRRIAWSSGRARGWTFGPVPDGVEREVEGWLLRGPGSDLEPLRLPNVFLKGDAVVKFYRGNNLLDRVRPPRAARAAEQHFRSLPIPSPRPLLAAAIGRSSLLVREYVRGILLSEAWQTDPVARSELVPFLVRMHRAGVLHGDLHPGNLIWTGSAWWLLDVEGVRHRLHSAARVIEGQWARLLAHLDDEPGLRGAYERYVAAHGDARIAVPSWERIRVEGLRLARQFRHVPSPGKAS